MFSTPLLAFHRMGMEHELSRRKHDVRPTHVTNSPKNISFGWIWLKIVYDQNRASQYYKSGQIIIFH